MKININDTTIYFSHIESVEIINRFVCVATISGAKHRIYPGEEETCAGIKDALEQQIDAHMTP